MTAYQALRTETEHGVRSIWLARPDEYNTITPLLRDETGGRDRQGRRRR